MSVYEHVSMHDVCAVPCNGLLSHLGVFPSYVQCSTATTDYLRLLLTSQLEIRDCCIGVYGNMAQ